MKEIEKNTKSKKKAVFLVLALVVAIAAVIAIIILASYPVNILEYKRNVKNSPIKLSVHDITKTSLSYDVVNNTDYSSIETGTQYFILRKGLLGYKQFYDGLLLMKLLLLLTKLRPYQLTGQTQSEN